MLTPQERAPNYPVVLGWGGFLLFIGAARSPSAWPRHFRRYCPDHFNLAQIWSRRIGHVRFSARRPLDARSLSLLAATEQCAGGTDLVRHWLSIFDCCQPMCVGRRRRWTTTDFRRDRILCPNPPCLCKRAEGRLQRRHELWSIQLAPALCTPIHRPCGISAERGMR
jgi:hypothetical protein